MSIFIFIIQLFGGTNKLKYSLDFSIINFILNISTYFIQNREVWKKNNALNSLTLNFYVESNEKQKAHKTVFAEFVFEELNTLSKWQTKCECSLLNGLGWLVGLLFGRDQSRQLDLVLCRCS